MSSPSDPLYGSLQALFGGWRTAPDGTITKPTPEPGSAPVEVPHLSLSPYVPWTNGANAEILRRNEALDQLIPLVSLVLQIKNFNANFQRIQQPPNPPYVYPAIYLVKMAEFGSTLGIYNGAVMMYAYDACKGDPAAMAERLIVGYNGWKNFYVDLEAQP